MPRSDLDALAAVPRLSTLWQARSSADARLRSEVLDLTREVAALRQSQREAANRPAAPRTPPTPPAPPVAARPAQAPSDAMWARHRAGALRFRLGRP
ncbi:MAG TPA: hypothetical protein VLM79_18125 [Kofleriaceae bacterium]|nr:hypothetical protein [Kofleriaceae bacterium]